MVNTATAANADVYAVECYYGSLAFGARVGMIPELAPVSALP